MKAKYIIMLVVCAVITLSFTVASTSLSKEKARGAEDVSSSQAGGLASEDPIK